jgi:hypothetical protein
MKKPKTITPDILIDLITRKDPVFKIEVEAQVYGKGGASIYVVMNVDGEEYLVDTYRELELIMKILLDMTEQVGEEIKKGTAYKHLVRVNMDTGEEEVLEETSYEPEESEDEPKMLS